MEEKTISLAELPIFPLVYKGAWEKIGECIRELSQECDTWKEKYEELKREYESSRPSVTDIAMEIEKNEKYEKLKGEYEELKRKYDLREAKEAKTVVGMPCPDPDEERDFYEETSDPDDDDYEDWEEKMVAAAEEHAHKMGEAFKRATSPEGAEKEKSEEVMV